MRTRSYLHNETLGEMAPADKGYADHMPGSAARRPTSLARQRWADGVAATIDMVGDAWAWLIMYESAIRGVTRFEDFQQHLGIARSTLTARLDALCSSGLLAKTARRYRPTAPGQEFTLCLLMAMNWGERWAPTPGGRPMAVEHVECGGHDGVEMRCARCARTAIAKEVSFEEMPPAPAAPASGRARVPGLELLERNGPNPVARTLKVTGDRWSSLVLRGAFFGLRRFDEFERSLGIAPNILSNRLGKLVELDVLRKVPYLTQPRRYEYRLTARGLDLYPMYLAMLSWGVTWTDADPTWLRLRHLPCGEDLRPQACCRACGQEVTSGDLRFQPRN